MIGFKAKLLGLSVEQVLADDPESVFGQWLRTALIVRADSTAARSMLAASTPRSRLPARTSMFPRAAMLLPRALGSTAIQSVRPLFMAPSLSTGRATC
jgi:hypothetical protein